MRYLSKNKPTVVISARDRLNFINILCCSLVNNKIIKVVTLRTNQTVEDIYLKKKKKHFQNLLFRYAYRYADKIIAVSKGVADDFSKRHDIDIKKVRVIYNPVFNEVMNSNNNIIPEKLKGIQTPSFKFILGVGRLRKQKDFKTLISAFKTIIEKKPNLNLIILGEGPERQMLEEIIKKNSLNDNVFLPGFVPNPQFYMDKAEVFVLSSLWEGFGNVLIDALGVGCKIVSTDCPSGPSEILEDGKYGALVEPGNKEQLAASVVKMLETDMEKTELINRAKDFSVDVISEKYLEYIFDGSNQFE